MQRRNIVFVCETPKFKMAYPSSELPFNNDVKFTEVKNLIVTKFPVLQNKELKFSFIDINGMSITIDLNRHIADYLNQTNSIFIELGAGSISKDSSLKDK